MRRVLWISITLFALTLVSAPNDADACKNAYQEIDRRDQKISRLRQDLQAERYVEVVAGALSYNGDVRRAWTSHYPGLSQAVSEPMRGIDGRERKVLRLLSMAVARADGALLVSKHAQADPDATPEVRAARLDHAVAVLRSVAKKNKRSRVYLGEALARSTRAQDRKEGQEILEGLHAKKRLSTGHGYLALSTLVEPGDAARAATLRARGDKLLKAQARRIKRESQAVLGDATPRSAGLRAKSKRRSKSAAVLF